MPAHFPALPEVQVTLSARGFHLADAAPLAGDVSPRRYLRVHLTTESGCDETVRSAVLALYGEELRGACRRFEATTELLSQAGVRVPEILASGCGEGWMLVEDLGSETLFERQGLGWETLLPFYRDAVSQIRRIAGLAREAVDALNPPLDGELLRRELAQTWERFLEPRKLAGSGAFEARLRRALDALVERLAAEPRVPAHRDLMVRNLVPLDGATVGLLDHQDLRMAPPLYDLASLLNDSLFPPPEVEREVLAMALGSLGVPRNYHRAAAQRTLKAVGTFARFGSARHLALIPATYGSFLRHFEALPEGAPLVPEMRRLWLSAA